MGMKQRTEGGTKKVRMKGKREKNERLIYCLNTKWHLVFKKIRVLKRVPPPPRLTLSQSSSKRTRGLLLLISKHYQVERTFLR